MPNEPTLICLTPVKDESWIIGRFLQCASLWADHIIVADQQSTDNTRDIARQFPKVTLIDNPIPRYDEAGRQKLLLDTARKIPLKPNTDRRFLLALDADELLTANFPESPEWQTLLALPKGTVICFNWINLQPDFRSAWIPTDDLPLGYIDDGAELGTSPIHNWRIPTPARAPRLVCHDIKVLHYQYTDWQRMKSKHRWYQCWELLNRPAKSKVDIFRAYHHMYAIPESQKFPVAPAWFKGYADFGIDVTSISKFNIYYWDLEIAKWLVEHGPEKFAQLDIWHLDYDQLWRTTQKADPSQSLRDPRSYEQKEIIAWLRETQATAATDPAVQKRDAELRAAGW